MTTNSADNTRPSPKVLNLLIKLKNTGKADATIKSTNAILRIISRHADLDNPEQVKQYIANRTGSNTYKHNLCKTYARYCRFARASTSLVLMTTPNFMLLPQTRDRTNSYK